MNLNKAFLCSFFFALLLLLASGPGVEARSFFCRRISSNGFHGLCFSSDKCAKVCISEGNNSGGSCDGIRRRCMCKPKNC